MTVENDRRCIGHLRFPGIERLHNGQIPGIGPVGLIEFFGQPFFFGFGQDGDNPDGNGIQGQDGMDDFMKMRYNGSDPIQ